MITPGQWAAKAAPSETSHADVYAGPTWVARVIYNGTNHGRVDDNARLIAAAPELLAALNAVMLGQLAGNTDPDAPRFKAAWAAIARAEGK